MATPAQDLGPRPEDTDCALMTLAVLGGDEAEHNRASARPALRGTQEEPPRKRAKTTDREGTNTMRDAITAQLLNAQWDSRQSPTPLQEAQACAPPPRPPTVTASERRSEAIRRDHSGQHLLRTALSSTVFSSRGDPDELSKMVITSAVRATRNMHVQAMDTMLAWQQRPEAWRSHAEGMASAIERSEAVQAAIQSK